MSKKNAGKSGITERAGDFAKNIWLAGLGAYGEAYDEFANQPKSLKELPALFKELVEKGAGIESTESGATTKRGAKSKKSKTAQRQAEASPFESESLEQRIRRMREGLNLNWSAPPASDIQRLEDKIDALQREIHDLKAMLKPAAKAAAKTTSRKAPAKTKAKAKTKTKAKVKKASAVKKRSSGKS